MVRPAALIGYDDIGGLGLCLSWEECSRSLSPLDVRRARRK